MKGGASLDGIDVAIVKTNGEAILEPGPWLHAPYDRDLKIWIRRAAKAALEGRDGAADIGKAAGEVTAAHVIAVEKLLAQSGLKRAAIDVIGFHGQTILHRPAKTSEDTARSWQVGDGAALANETKIDVVNDFRSADIAAGGEGAPFSPIYHAALVHNLARQHAVGVINLGGVTGVTFAPAGGGALDLVAYDCGPGSDLIDEWMQLKTGAPMDKDSALVRSGNVHKEHLRMMLLNPYLRRKPPKSLDRYDFKLDPVLDLSTADGAATLTAFAAACVRASEKFLPDRPGEWIVVGAGRNNRAQMEALSKALDAPVAVAEEAGWRGDVLEAECFAYLAVRSLRKLPLSYPNTTRVSRPMRGGVYHRAPI